VISVHTQFFIAYVMAMLLTLPLFVLSVRRRLPHARLTVAAGLVGYGIIGLMLLIDSFVDPPLLFHGFIPGIGIGILLESLALFVQDLSVPAHSAPRILQDRWLLVFGACSLLMSGMLHLWLVGATSVFYTGIFAGLPLGLGIAHPILHRA
jgi:hypothetical protein